jgi:hypothetical protein
LCATQSRARPNRRPSSTIRFRLWLSEARKRERRAFEISSVSFVCALRLPTSFRRSGPREFAFSEHTRGTKLKSFRT